MTVTLRPYQQALIEGGREAYRQGANSVLFCLPTGGGKTVTASTIVHGAAQRRNTVWWLCHRRELVAQASRTFYDLGIPHGTVQAGHVSDPRALVQVGSIQTVANRLDQLPEPGLIIFDEAHHIGAGSWDALFHRFPRARKLGLTATPWRLDGQGLGRWFNVMVEGPTVAELIEAGALSPYRYFAPSKPDLSAVGITGGDYQRGALSQAMARPQIVGDAIEHYRNLCPGKRAVAFAAGVENSMQIAAQFNAAGIPAEHVDGSMSAEMRDAAVERFKAGQTLILSNADLFGEGFDVPAIEAAILLRPTKSLSLHLQQCGRALRPIEGKTAIILDHAGNIDHHGLPDDVRQWDLADREKRRKGEVAEVTTRQCKNCFYVYRPAPKCPGCGHVPEVVAREIEVVEGTLAEVRKSEIRSITRETSPREISTLEGLRTLARLRGYKRGWASHVWKERLAKGRAA